MALRYGFFDSEITGYDDEGMPEFDRAESSNFLASYISQFIAGDGVLADPADSFQIVADTGMTLKVRPGYGIVRGRFAMDTAEEEITLETAPTQYKRIDRVVLRANYLERLCEIVVKTGTAANTPTAPELLQPESGDYYELSLATIAINSNQTVITQANITDTRYDSSVCGVVTQPIEHLDTSVFFAQLDQFYTEFVEKSNASYSEFETMADTAYASFTETINTYIDELKAQGAADLSSIEESFEQYQTDSKSQFDTWFANVKDQLSEDTAGNLQLEIEALQEENTELKTQLDTLNAKRWLSRQASFSVASGSSDTSETMTVDMSTLSEASIDVYAVVGSGVTLTVGGQEVMQSSVWGDVLSETDVIHVTARLECRDGLWLIGIAAPVDADTTVQPVVTSGYLSDSTDNDISVSVVLTSASGALSAGCEGEVWGR